VYGSNALECAVATSAKLFGRAAIRHEGRWLQPPAGKTSALLYFLAYGGGWVGRDELTYLFWPDSTEVQARRNLRRILTTIRALPYARALDSDAHRIRWAIDTDVRAFRQALSEQRRATAAELYEGVLLDGLALPGSPEFEGWLGLERQACHELWRLSSLDWATEFEAVDRFRDAGEILARLYRADAFDEDVLRRYLRALHADGQRTKALAEFDAFTQSLQAEFGTEPEQATVEIGDAIRRGQPPVFTSPEAAVTNAGSSSRPKHNLAEQPTAFIGRDPDRAKLTAVLGEPTTRLVTIVGPGGMGKTRLAVEVARTRVDSFEHGVCFVGFDAVASPELAIYAVADALGFSLFGARSPEEQLREHLRDKQLLLVLDSLEHLVADLQWISDLLESAAGVQILATSRERLNVRAERIFDLASLPVPEDGEREAEHYDAVRLFAERAAAVSSGFSLDATNVSAVTRICRLVEGLPLAIEMAARWLRTLRPDAIATEIERGIDILQSAARDLPARHRSMQAVFDHSWELLSSEERDALCKLSVCDGGFTREAAADIASADLQLLSSLIDKSFLSFTPAGRYVEHPLMLQYTRLQFARQPDERARTREKHGRHYLRLVRDRENDMRTLERKQTLKALAAELPNIRAAWAWAIESERVDEIAASSLALGNLFESSVPEGAAFFAQAVAALDGDDPEHRAALGYALVQQAEYAQWLAQDGGDAPSSVERALTLLTPEGEPRGFIRAFARHAKFLWYGAGRTNEAGDMLREGLRLAREHGFRREIGECLCLLVLLDDSGDPAQVKQLAERSLVEVRGMGDLVHVAFIQQQLGVQLVLDDDVRGGLALLEESLQLARDLDFQRFEPFILDDLAMAAYKLRDVRRAEALSLEQLASAKNLGMENATRDASWILGRVATMRGDDAAARAHLVRGLRPWWKSSSVLRVLIALLPFVHLALARGHVDRAAELMAIVRSELRDDPGVHRQLRRHLGVELDELMETLDSHLNVGESDVELEPEGAMSLEDAVIAILES
jgi:predicted ATPase/DNA-binding SARP family transcriptional activator